MTVLKYWDAASSSYKTLTGPPGPQGIPGTPGGATGPAGPPGPASTKIGTHLLDYGAKFDGVTNDTTAWQNAIAAWQLVGGRLILPPGTSIVSSALSVTMAANKSGLITGSGHGSTMIKWTSASNGLTIHYPIVDWWDHPNVIKVEGIDFVTAVSSTTTVALQFISGGFVSGWTGLQTTVRDCGFYGVPYNSSQWGTAIVFNGIPQTTVSDCLILGTQNAVTATGISYIGAAGGVIQPHALHNINAYYLYYGILTNSYVEGIAITNCNFTSVNYGIFVNGVLVGGTPDVQQVSMTMTQIAAYVCCVRMTAALDCQIVGNLFMMLGTAANCFIIMLDSCHRMQVVGNDLIGSSLSNGQSGIGIFNSLGFNQTPLPSIYQGNTIEATQVGIDIGSNVKGQHIGFNVYAPGTTGIIDAGVDTYIAGEMLSANVASIAVPTTGVIKNILLLTIKPGTWDISGTVGTLPASTTFTSTVNAWVSASSATQPVFYAGQNTVAEVTPTVANLPVVVPTGQLRLTVLVDTVVYLSASIIFSSGAMAASGYISARRVGI